MLAFLRANAGSRASGTQAVAEKYTLTALWPPPPALSPSFPLLAPESHPVCPSSGSHEFVLGVPRLLESLTPLRARPSVVSPGSAPRLSSCLDSRSPPYSPLARQTPHICYSLNEISSFFFGFVVVAVYSAIAETCSDIKASKASLRSVANKRARRREFTRSLFLSRRARSGGVADALKPETCAGKRFTRPGSALKIWTSSTKVHRFPRSLRKRPATDDQGSGLRLHTFSTS